MKQNIQTSYSEPQCWLICTSQDNFQVDRQNGFSVEGFRTRSRRLVSEVKPGDKFVVYINQLQRFGATLQATGKPYTDEKTRIRNACRVFAARHINEDIVGKISSYL